MRRIVLLAALLVAVLIVPTSTSASMTPRQVKDYVLKTYLVPAEDSTDAVYTAVAQPKYELLRDSAQFAKAQDALNNWSGDHTQDAMFARWEGQIAIVNAELQDAHNRMQAVNEEQNGQIRDMKK